MKNFSAFTLSLFLIIINISSCSKDDNTRVELIESTDEVLDYISITKINIISNNSRSYEITNSSNKKVSIKNIVLQTGAGNTTSYSDAEIALGGWNLSLLDSNDDGFINPYETIIFVDDDGEINSTEDYAYVIAVLHIKDNDELRKEFSEPTNN